MILDDEELNEVLAKRVDRIIFYSGDKPVLDIPLGKLVKQRFENDPKLQRELLRQVLQSESSGPLT